MTGRGYFEETAAQLDGAQRVGWAEAVTKAAITAQDWSSAWGSDSGQYLADAFRQSLRDTSVLDACARHAIPIPERATGLQLLSGATADAVAEGVPKVATRLTLSPQNLTTKKVAAILAMTAELVRTPAAERVIGSELRTKVSEATNTAFLGLLTATSVTAGTTPTATVQAALDALDDCAQAVIAAPGSFVRKLAAESNGRIGITGGELFPGCMVVATAAAGTDLYAIAADRIALREEPLKMLPATDASVQLDDAPSGGAQSLVSLWQSNLIGLLIERYFSAYGECIKVDLS